jgi:hypothetical protein
MMGLWRCFAACVLAIASGHTPFEFASLVVRAEKPNPKTTTRKKLSIPSQILGAKVPSQESFEDPLSPLKQQQQLWVYEGALYDPLDGRKVAKVRGLELVRPLEDTSHLAIDALLKHPNATYEDSKTVWSQKIFCYTTTQDVLEKGKRSSSSSTTLSSGKEGSPPTQQTTRESILNNVRVRPRSPRKEVPLDQAVAVYETATTFVSRKIRGSSDNGIHDDDEEEEQVLVHSEWPNGQTMWGNTKDCTASNEAASIDFTVFAKLRNKNSPLYHPDLIRNDDDDDKSGKIRRTLSDGDIVVSPKRASLVQFGSSSGTMETKHKYGARETYSYRNLPSEDTAPTTKQVWASFLPWNHRRVSRRQVDKSAGSGPTLHYTRYGEGPPFYAPGRMCMLELKGKPVTCLDEVSPLLRALVRGSCGGGNPDNKNNSRQGSPPPVANFHWGETIGSESENNSSIGDATKERAKQSRGRKKSSTNRSKRSIPRAAPISIQKAWNLRESRSAGGTLPMGSASSTAQRRPRNKQSPQPMALKLVVPDGAAANGKLPAWKAMANTGKKRAVAVWNRIKASTTMEARS